METPTPLAYTCDYTVQTYDIENRRRMTVAALVKLMQEAAMQNVMEMKLSAWDMEPQHISWVLLRKSMKIMRLPNIGERVKVVTYPAGFEKFFTYRDYKVFDENGGMLAYSSSTWLLMDTQTRRMARIPEFILAFEKDMPPADECLPRPDTKLPAFGTPDAALPFRVNWHDLDFNGHLNNVFYIQWMLEALPDQVLLNGTLKEFDIIYKMEAHWKEELVSAVQQVGDHQFLHRLSRKEDGKEMALGASWLEG
ncbi:MAG: hypothetical protein H6577_03775 [Lewinellaceae bacterium]|nr:hypothetical protein [Saprospiraceae bacterium]MCB9337222.1 hypothetical protein [Lewinellaceae bacterium]